MKQRLRGFVPEVVELFMYVGNMEWNGGFVCIWTSKSHWCEQFLNKEALVLFKTAKVCKELTKEESWLMGQAYSPFGSPLCDNELQNPPPRPVLTTI